MSPLPAHWGLPELLDRFTGLALRPSRVAEVILIAGELQFSVSNGESEEMITDSFPLEIHVPSGFASEAPCVWEVGGRIPRDFHTNPDRSLCLGSPLKIRMLLDEKPNLLGFAETCLIPYLYGYCRYERENSLPFGELAHGCKGLFDDYKRILGVDDNKTCVELIALLAFEKRIANKLPCPCSSGKRVGRCHNLVLNKLRRLAPSEWFREHAKMLANELSGNKED